MSILDALRRKSVKKRTSAKVAAVVLPKKATPQELRKRWDKKKTQVGVLANNIQALRYNVTGDLKDPGDEKEFLTALVVKLMDASGERVGNDDSARNGHRGITGLLKSQVKVDGNQVFLKYTGKSGVKQDKSITDASLASALKIALKLSPSKYLFCTSDDFKIKNDRINRYLSDFDVTAKDLRGFSANRWMIQKLKSCSIADNEKDRKKEFNRIAKLIAAKVGHGPSMLKKQYLLPGLEETYIEKGKIINIKGKGYEAGGEIEVSKSGGDSVDFEPDEQENPFDMLKRYVEISNNFDVFNRNLLLHLEDDKEGQAAVMQLLNLQKADSREISDQNTRKLKGFYDAEKKVINKRRKENKATAQELITDRNLDNIYALAFAQDAKMLKDIENSSHEIRYPVQLITLPEYIIAMLKELQQKGHKALVVGGAVRDAILGIEPKDIDIEVYNISYADLGDFLSAHGSVNLVGKNFGVIKFVHSSGDMEYDFSVPRKENKMGVGHKEFEITFDETMTVKDAAMRRDFTMNSLAYNPITNIVYDYFGGIADIKNGIIRHTSDKFTEDILRVLRAMQFQARFNFTIAQETVLLMRDMLAGDEFLSLPKERVFEEWYKWAAKGIRHDGIFQFMRDTTLINYYPELKALKETRQDAVYHPEGDVEIHTTLCLGVMDSILAVETEILGDQKAILVMAILLHDIAKPPTTKEEMKNGRMTITSNGHEAMGGTMAEEFLKGIGFHKSLIDPISNLVANHLAGVSISTIENENGKVKAVKKLSKRLYPATIQQLLYVMEADSNGRGGEKYNVATGTGDLTRIAEEIKVTDTPYEFILLGRHLIEQGMKPSRKFGDILRQANEAQLNGEFSDLQGAKGWLRSNMDKFGQGGLVEPKIQLPDTTCDYDSLKPILERQGYEITRIGEAIVPVSDLFTGLYTGVTDNTSMTDLFH